MPGAGIAASMSGQMMAATRPGAAHAQSTGAWERLASERPDAAQALQALFTALLADAQHGGAASAATGAGASAPADAADVLADEAVAGDEVLPFGGECLPGGWSDIAAALGFVAAGGAAGAGPETAAGQGAGPSAAFAGLVAAGPRGEGEAAWQSWAREVLQRAEMLMRGAEDGAAPLPAAELEALALRLEQATGASAVPGQAAAASAALAAMLKGAGESAARGEAMMAAHVDASAAEAAPAVVAPAPAHSLQAGAGERAVPSWSLNTPLHQPQQWGEELGDRVRWMIGQQMQTAELKITPPQLGTIEVRISMHKDQMSISFAAPSAAVREALEEAMPRLREMLGGSGYETTVDVEVSQHSLPQRRDTAPDAYAAGGGGVGEGEGEAAAVAGVTTLRSAGAAGLIDFYA
jgi:flagellar hook-length control protein FliK